MKEDRLCFFFDESGQNLKNTPLVLIGGIEINESQIENFENRFKQNYFQLFGVNYEEIRDLKGKSLLERSKIKEAQFYPFMKLEEIQRRSAFLLSSQSRGIASYGDISAYAKANLLFVKSVIDLLEEFNCQIHAVYLTINNFKEYQKNIQNIDKKVVHSANKVMRLLDKELLTRVYDYIFRISETPIFIFDKTSPEIDNLRLELFLNDEMKAANQNFRTVASKDFEFQFLASNESVLLQVADIVLYLLNYGYGTWDNYDIMIENVFIRSHSETEQIRDFYNWWISNHQ